MSKKKDRKRAEAGWVHRGGKLVRREEVEGLARDRKLAQVARRLRRDHHLTIIGNRIYARQKPDPSASDVGVEPREGE